MPSVTGGTSLCSVVHGQRIGEHISEKVFDFRPRAIIEQLGLRNPIFLPTAAYGHFGRTPESKTLQDGRSVDLFTWERSDRVDDLRDAVGL